MTPEEAKNLKAGDAVDIHATIEAINKGDNSMACLKITPEPNHNIYHCVPIEFLHAATPAPKYDPYRKFRMGDIVEPCKGRAVYACEWEDCVFHKMDGKYEVQGDEKVGHVSVIDKETGIKCYVSAFALELVTPVEEQKIFFYENEPELPFYFVYFGIPDNCELVAHFSKDYYSEKDVQAECDRLNAEHRKDNN